MGKGYGYEARIVYKRLRQPFLNLVCVMNS